PTNMITCSLHDALPISIIFLLLSITVTAQQAPEGTTSELVILNIKSGEQKTILKEVRHFEAPNWSRDGEFLLINSGGFLEKVDLDRKSTRLNSSHVKNS